MSKGDSQKIVIDLATDVSIYTSSIMLGLIIGYAIGAKSIIASLTLVGIISPIIIAFTATALEVFDKVRSRFMVEELKAEGREEGKTKGIAEGKAEVYQEIAAWNDRRLAAEARDEKFTEPPPIPSQEPKM